MQIILKSCTIWETVRRKFLKVTYWIFKLFYVKPEFDQIPLEFSGFDQLIIALGKSVIFFSATKLCDVKR